MIIKVGDTVTVNKPWGIQTRTGTITTITLSTNTDDPVGDVRVDNLDLSLDHGGSITYVTEDGQEYWAYLATIEIDKAA